MLPGYCKEIEDKYGIKVGDVKKLIPNFVNNKTYFLKYTDRSTHITHKILVKNYPDIHEIKRNKPIYVGFTVLESSKWLMHDFHYIFVKKHFEAKLLFTDTESLTNEIRKCLWRIF